MDNNKFKRDMFTGDIEVPKELEARIKTEVDSIKVKKRSFLKVVSASAAVLIIFILSVSFIPPLKAYAKNIPFLNIFVELMHRDKGLIRAKQNGYLPISKSITTRSNGYEFTVGNVFVDDQRISFVCEIKPDKLIRDNPVTVKTLIEDKLNFYIKCKNVDERLCNSGSEYINSQNSFVYSYNAIFSDPDSYKKFISSKPRSLYIEIIKDITSKKKDVVIGRVNVPFNKNYIQQSKNININYSIKSKKLNKYFKKCTLKELSMSPTMMTLKVYIKPKKGFIDPMIDQGYIEDKSGKLLDGAPGAMSGEAQCLNSSHGIIQKFYIAPSLYFKTQISSVYFGFKNIYISEQYGKKSFVIDVSKKASAAFKLRGRKIVILNPRIEGKYLAFDSKVSYYIKGNQIQNNTISYEEKLYRSWGIKEPNKPDAHNIPLIDKIQTIIGKNGEQSTVTHFRIRVFNNKQKKYKIFIKDVGKKLNIKGKYLIKLH